MKSAYSMMFLLVALLPGMSHAYTDKQFRNEVTTGVDIVVARKTRFYIGGMYDFSMWNGFTDDNDIHVSGRNTSSFEGMAGVRLFDFLRLEANYIRTKSEYNAFKLTGDTAMVNAIFDIRVRNWYRLFYKQPLVPYIGVGGGASLNSSDDIHIDDKISPVASAMAGLGIGLGKYFTIDLGYRYFYMFDPKFDGIKELNPTAHQLRAGVRVNF